MFRALLLICLLSSIAFSVTTQPASRPTVIELTKAASEQLKRIIKEQALDSARAYLEVGVRPPAAGQKAFTYTMDLNENRPAADDVIVESGGIRIRVSQRAAIYLQGTIIDYAQRDGHKGFLFKNPNATEKEP